MAVKLATKDSEKLMKYIIQENPILKEGLSNEIQGQSIQKIGQLIMKSNRYRNAFINTINVLALTLIVDDEYSNPWENFTEQGEIRFGQTVREMIMDLVDAQDYNEHMNSATHFLETEVPNLFNYFHDLNFQKFYKATVNENEFAMAFEGTEGIFNLITLVYNRLRTSYNYDRYIVDKYQVQRRIIDGTVPAIQITNFDTNDVADNVAFMKEYSNNMTFMSPNYNPAGLRRATPFSKQRTILSTGFEAKMTTKVLATSYFKDEAELKTKLAMIDGFANNDWARLEKLLGDSYTKFTDEELTKLNDAIAMIITDDWFKDYRYLLSNESNEFVNPESFNKTMWLHAWRIFSTSPFEQCIVFTKSAPSVTSVTVSPAAATVTKGQSLQLSSQVYTNGITNKSVMWSVDSISENNKATINQKGLLEIPADYDSSDNGTAGVSTIEIPTILETGDKLKVNGIEYTVSADDDTKAKQITALKSALNVSAITDNYTIGGTSTTCTLTEKSGKYGLVGIPTFVFTPAENSDGEATITETTEGKHVGTVIIVTAISIFDKTKSGTATITVA